jgi:hypothetical protein
MRTELHAWSCLTPAPCRLLKEKDAEAGTRAGGLKKRWEGVDYAYDRKRWLHPSKTRPDNIVELDALLQLKEVCGAF